MSTFALITARGGSKGIPRKNIKFIAGKPLIVWTIEAAQRFSLLSGVVVSTDDVEIAEVALQAGAQVPFMRPAKLAQDQTPGLDPVLHGLEQMSIATCPHCSHDCKISKLVQSSTQCTNRGWTLVDLLI